MKKVLYSMLIVVLLIFILGCLSSTSFAPKFPYGLMISLFDLPKGFEHTDGEFPDIEGGISHFVKYAKNNELGNVISHQITIYPSSEWAKGKYPDWVNQWTTDSWIEISDIKFVPKDSADTFTLKCLDLRVDNSPMKSCRFIQLHKNLIVLILVNFGTNTISYTEFEEVLVKLDQRLPSEEINFSELVIK